MAWEVDLLKAIGAPITKENLTFLRTWQRYEGGWTHNNAMYNPLNTTQGPGIPINRVGVKSFPDYKTGINSTAQTILNGRYPNIVQGLRSGNPYQYDLRADLSVWVSGSPTKGLSYANKIIGTRAGKTPQPPVPQQGIQQTPAIQGYGDRRRQVASSLLDFVLDYAKTGKIDSTRLARRLGAVSEDGTVQPPTSRGELPGSKSGGLAGGVVNKVLAAAHTQVGKPYKFGSGPGTDSFDCSELVQWAWAQVGVNIPRTTYEQMKVLPKKSWDKLSPGDLIYKNDGGHVVMYVGGGKVIAAPYTGTVVQYQPLSKFKSGNYHVRSVL